MRESEPSLDLCLVSPVSSRKESPQISKLDDLLRRLEGEKAKVEAFKHELPFCLLLLDNAIFRLKQQAASEANNVEKVGDADWLNHLQLWLPTDDGIDGILAKEAALLCATQCIDNGREIKGGREKNELRSLGDTGKKPRRYWSQTLHRRFMTALENLGGSNAATPKQIRELMKIDGLSNDEVKSHLQKHRLRMEKHRTLKMKHGSEIKL